MHEKKCSWYFLSVGKNSFVFVAVWCSRLSKFHYFVLTPHPLMLLVGRSCIWQHDILSRPADLWSVTMALAMEHSGVSMMLIWKYGPSVQLGCEWNFTHMGSDGSDLRYTELGCFVRCVCVRAWCFVGFPLVSRLKGLL